MAESDEERYRTLKRTHQQLLRKWKKLKGLCIVCGEREGNESDHLPPKVLFPSDIRTPQTEFFTFPVCAKCNRASSDEDFLFSVALSFWLNQESIIANKEPTDPDLLALYRQTHGQIQDPSEAERRTQLLQCFIGTDPGTGRPAINLTSLPLSQTLTKIVKSIYWLHAGGDLIERHNPGWWIRTDVDTSRPRFIEKHLKVSHADFHWNGRFIAHFTIGLSQNGIGGLISASLHFYTKRAVGNGMSWLVTASPTRTIVDGRSLYEHSKSLWGTPTIEPREKVCANNALHSDGNSAAAHCHR
jgi:hypothetical protein